MTTRKPTQKQEPLSLTAHRKIKEQIITLKLTPGQQVDESELEKRLAIGRTPIREALFRLVSENLVHVVHGRGFFIKNITLSDMKDLFEALFIMERSAIALASRRIRTPMIHQLYQRNAEMEAAWKDQNFFRMTHLNSLFHQIIYQATENHFLISSLNSLQTQSQRLAYICYSKDVSDYNLESHARISSDDHNGLAYLLENHRQKKAVELMTRHIKHFQKRVSHFMSPSMETLDLILYPETG